MNPGQLVFCRNGHEKKWSPEQWNQGPYPGISWVFLHAHQFSYDFMCISMYMTALPTRHWPSLKYCGYRNANFQEQVISLNEKEDCSQSETILITELYRKAWQPGLTRLPNEGIISLVEGIYGGHFHNLGIGHVLSYLPSTGKKCVIGAETHQNPFTFNSSSPCLPYSFPLSLKKLFC